MMERELRALRGVEVRAADDGGAVIDGYASVTDVWYDVAGGPERGGFREQIAGGAFDKTLDEQLDAMFLLVDHDGLPVAGTRNGSLVLEADGHGLRAEAHPDTASAYNNEIVTRVRSGLLDSMSFAFAAMQQEWNGDYTERRITELRLFEVSVVKWPANPATVVQMRKAVAELRAAAQPVEPAPPGMSLATAKALAFNLSRAAR